MPHPLNYQNGKGARGKGRGEHVGLNCTPLGKEEAKGGKIADSRNSVQRPAYGSVSHVTSSHNAYVLLTEFSQA